MIHKILIAALLILSGNPLFSQDSIQGRTFDYETNQVVMAGIVDLKNRWGNRNPRLVGVSDKDGNFKIKSGGEKRQLEFSFVGYYRILFMNVPKSEKNLDFGKVRMVPYHLDESSNDSRIEQDQQLTMKVVKEYRINILGKTLKPHFEGRNLVFDFDQGEE